MVGQTVNPRSTRGRLPATSLLRCTATPWTSPIANPPRLLQEGKAEAAVAVCAAAGSLRTPLHGCEAGTGATVCLAGPHLLLLAQAGWPAGSSPAALGLTTLLGTLALLAALDETHHRHELPMRLQHVHLQRDARKHRHTEAVEGARPLTSLAKLLPDSNTHGVTARRKQALVKCKAKWCKKQASEATLHLQASWLRSRPVVWQHLDH